MMLEIVPSSSNTAPTSLARSGPGPASFTPKLKPRYQSMFLVYRDEADLPHIGIAMTRAYLPNTPLRELLGMRPDGRVEWTAPKHLDPDQTPRINTLHHPPDLTDPDPPGGVGSGGGRCPSE